MGGRGSSFNGGERNEQGKQRFDYKMTRLGERPAEEETKREPFRTDGTLKLNEEKIKVFVSTDSISENILKDNMEQVKNLQEKVEKQYGIDTKATLNTEKANLSFYGVQSKSNTVAYYINNQIVFNKQYYKDQELIVKRTKEAVKKEYHARCDDKNLQVYTITHEYGHFLQDVIIKKRLEKKGEDPNIHTNKIKESKKIWQEILQINKEKYKSNNEFISNYGYTNPNEFFAEAFAESQLSSNQSTLAKSTIVLLEREGLQYNKEQV